MEMNNTTILSLLPVLLCCIISILAVPLPSSDEKPTQPINDLWFYRLFLNLMGYATILVPAYFVIRYFKRIKYNETGKIL